MKKDKKVIVLKNEIEIEQLPSLLRGRVTEILGDKKMSVDAKKSLLDDAYNIIFTYDLKLRLREEMSSATILKEAALWHNLQKCLGANNKLKDERMPLRNTSILLNKV